MPQTPEQKRRYKRAYDKNNRERVRRYDLEYRQRNREALKIARVLKLSVPEARQLVEQQ